jgi:hypothetical protein
LLNRVVDMMRYFLINTPLVPNRLPIRSVHHPTPLGTWSRQGLVVNTLRTWGREPLRSASRCLGFIVNNCFGNPGHRLVVGLSSGSCYLQDPLGPSTAPSSFLGQNFVGMHPHQDFVALRLLCLTVAFPEGHYGCGRRFLIWHNMVCGMVGQGNPAGIPPCLRSAGTSISNVG